jgi:hypothetical protein
LAYPFDSDEQGLYTDEAIIFSAARHRKFSEDPIKPTGCVESLKRRMHECRR